METDPLALPQPNSRRTLHITILVILLTIVASFTYGWWRLRRWHEDWNRLGPLAPSGGLYFQPRLELEVPIFRQADDRWRNDLLGNTPASLGDGARELRCGYGSGPAQ